jgi:hypothetical protein
MLTYVVYCITAYLVIEILRAPSMADAAGPFLVSALIPLPVYIVGHSAAAGVFAIDICLLALIAAHKLPRVDIILDRGVQRTGIGWLVAFLILAISSGAVNFAFVDSEPLRFYAFTIVKFCEYVLAAIALVSTRPDARQLHRICVFLVSGILIYETLHVVHLSGILPLSGEQYVGQFPEDAQGYVPDFSDRTAYFLTSARAVVGGTASISAWLSIMIFELYRGKLRLFAVSAAILSTFSVVATSSRSDIAGLAVSAVLFALSAPPRRWRVYACTVLVASGLYATFLILSPAAERTEATTRLSELWDPNLRADGNYADRSNDRRSVLRYLPEHPRNLLIGVGPGNYHWYQEHRITRLYMGHNSYVHWVGELGIGGGVILLGWCLCTCSFAIQPRRDQTPICQIAARTCLALVVGRMVAAWGDESLFGTEVMGYYSIYFVGVVYLLASVAATPSVEVGTKFHRVTSAQRRTTELVGSQLREPTSEIMS